MNQKLTKKDVFTSMAQSFDEIHSNIEQATPVYVQSLSNLQQEYLSAWKNFMCSGISMQKEYAQKTGFNVESAEITIQMIQKITEGMVKGFKLQSQFTQMFLDASKENIRRGNESSAVFAESNKKLINSVTSVWA